MVKKNVMRLLAVIAGGLALGFLALFLLAPSLNWGAAATPGAIEKSLAGLVLRQWVRRQAAVQNNPLPASEQNLKTGQREFGEHCAVCHGTDGSAHDLLGADFYPPVARLQKGAPGWSDGELFFIIDNGIRYTGMPGFGAHHRAATIWRIILWVRHLPHLSAAEKAQIQGRGEFMEHEEGGAHTD
jgi:mono/diheme cytochrome c family protein